MDKINLELSDEEVLTRLVKFYSVKNTLDVEYNHPHLSIFNNKLGDSNYSYIQNIKNISVHNIIKKYEDIYSIKCVYDTHTRYYDDPNDHEGWGMDTGDFVEYFDIEAPSYLLDGTMVLDTALQTLTKEYYLEYLKVLHNDNTVIASDIISLSENMNRNTKMQMSVYNNLDKIMCIK